MSRIHIRKMHKNTGYVFAVEMHQLAMFLESQGFDVQPLPAVCCGLSVSHSNPGLLTVLLITHSEFFRDWTVF